MGEDHDYEYPDLSMDEFHRRRIEGLGQEDDTGRGILYVTGACLVVAMGLTAFAAKDLVVSIQENKHIHANLDSAAVCRTDVDPDLYNALRRDDMHLLHEDFDNDGDYDSFIRLGYLSEEKTWIPITRNNTGDIGFPTLDPNAVRLDQEVLFQDFGKGISRPRIWYKDLDSDGLLESYVKLQRPDGNPLEVVIEGTDSGYRFVDGI